MENIDHPAAITTTRRGCTLRKLQTVRENFLAFAQAVVAPPRDERELRFLRNGMAYPLLGYAGVTLLAYLSGKAPEQSQNSDALCLCACVLLLGLLAALYIEFIGTIPSDQSDITLVHRLPGLLSFTGHFMFVTLGEYACYKIIIGILYA